jgi:hypothetical protein
MEDLGQLVSEFVEERVENPREGEQELWPTGVSACLFSVAFEVLVHCNDLRKGPEACEEVLNETLDDTAKHAAKWIDERLGRAMLRAETACRNGLQPIHIDLCPQIRHHLNLYFNEALNVLTERGYKLDTARSHACWAMLGSVIEEMMLRGWIKDANLAANFRQKYFERAESMSLEIRHLLEKKAKS